MRDIAISAERARNLLWAGVRFAVLDTETLMESEMLPADGMAEVEAAIAAVQAIGAPVSLAPSPRRTRLLQHRAIEAAGFTSASEGEEPDRAVRVLPPVEPAPTGPQEPLRGANHRLIEIALTPVAGGHVGDTWHSLVSPGAKVDARTFETHGIEDSHLTHAPDFATIAPELVRRLAPHGQERVVLVAWNASFDVGHVLRREFERIGKPMPLLPVLDPKRGLVRMADQTAGSLEQLLVALGITNQKQHRAWGDARATAEALVKLLDAVATKGISDLDEVLRACGDQTTATVPEGKPREKHAAIPEVVIPEAHARRHAKRPRDGSTFADFADHCAKLRCPDLAVSHASLVRRSELPPPTVLDALVEVMRRRVADKDGPGANAALGAIATGIRDLWCPIPPAEDYDGRFPITRQAAIALFHEAERTVAALPRCAGTDSCPDCRAGRPCPRDELVRSLAPVVLSPDWERGRMTYNATWLNWIRPKGRRGGWPYHRKTTERGPSGPPAGPRLADAATAVMLRWWGRLGGRGGAVREIEREILDCLRAGCRDPMVWEMWAWQLAKGGRPADLAAAIEACDQGLHDAPRHPDSGWTALRTTRHLLAGRLARTGVRWTLDDTSAVKVVRSRYAGPNAHRRHPLRFVISDSAVVELMPTEAVGPAAPDEVLAAVARTIRSLSGQGSSFIGPTADDEAWARIFVARARPWSASGARAQDAHESRHPREVVGLLWNSDPSRFTVVAGWALDEDGERWRPHVWAWDGEAKVIVEPSGATRLIYLGAPLSETEATEITAESPAWLSIA